MRPAVGSAAEWIAPEAAAHGTEDRPYEKAPEQTEEQQQQNDRNQYAAQTEAGRNARTGMPAAAARKRRAVITCRIRMILHVGVIIIDSVLHADIEIVIIYVSLEHRFKELSRALIIALRRKIRL